MCNLEDVVVKLLEKSFFGYDVMLLDEIELLLCMGKECYELFYDVDGVVKVYVLVD